MSANRVIDKYTDAEAVDAMGAKGDANPLHHNRTVKYTDAEVDAIVATHTAIAGAHHVKYTDAEVDAIVLTHKNIAAAHHSKYTDGEAVVAVATADNYIKNNVNDEMTGILTAKDYISIAPYANFQIIEKPTLTYVGDGSYIIQTFYTIIYSGATSGNREYLHTGDQYIGGSWMFSSKLSLGSATTNSEIWLGFFHNIITTPINTCNHFGFKLLNGDLYASNGNGTNGTQTDLGIHYDNGGSGVLSLDWNGTNIRFWVNGILKATNTTNLPASGQKRIFVYDKTTDNIQKTLLIEYINIQNI